MEIKIHNLSRNFGEKTVLRNLTHVFESGKLYVIKGVSGCGKTTLLNILGGIDTEYSGELSSEQPYRTGYVFQSSLLLADISVLDNLLLIHPSARDIIELSSKLGVDTLLDKYPRQLSGGERQRISVVRALLTDPEVLLADEPTASLDAANSAAVAETLAGLRHPGRIIIVATHENCFDSFADEILDLHFGTIRSVRKKTAAEAGKRGRTASPPARPLRSSLVQISARRMKKKLRWSSLLPIAAAFLLVLLVSTLQHNFEREYLRLLGDDYPLDLILFTPSEYQAFPYRDSVQIYRNYVIREEGVTAYYLPPKSASVFCIPQMIAFGQFPTSDREILVSPEYVQSHFGGTEQPEDCIGQTVSVLGESFLVSGVLADMSSSNCRINYNNDPFYHINLRKKDDNIVYIPYGTICRIGQEEPVAEGFIVASYPNLLRSDAVYRALCASMRDGKPNFFYSEIGGIQKAIDSLTRAFVFVLATGLLISCIFLVTMISCDLFYRKKEIGYLQIFGIPKSRILAYLSWEYLLKLLLSLAVAGGLYAVAILGYRCFAGSFVLCQVPFSLGTITAMAAVYMATTLVAIRCFLKKSVFDLIYA